MDKKRQLAIECLDIAKRVLWITKPNESLVRAVDEIVSKVYDTRHKFNLGDIVLVSHCEQGAVVAITERQNAETSYCVRYLNGAGCMVEQEWAESALELERLYTRDLPPEASYFNKAAA